MRAKELLLLIEDASITIDQALNILNISRDDSRIPTKLRKAYYMAARIHHPDMGGSNGAMRRVKTSYDLLQSKAFGSDIDIGDIIKGYQRKPLSKVDEIDNIVIKLVKKYDMVSRDKTHIHDDTIFGRVFFSKKLNAERFASELEDTVDLLMVTYDSNKMSVVYSLYL